MPERLTGPIVLVALAIALVTLAIVFFVHRGRQTTMAMYGTSPMLASLVCGLLSSIGLLVLLPSSVEVLGSHNIGADRAILIFICSACGMFFLHHVVLDHQCGGTMVPKAKDDDEPAKQPALSQHWAQPDQCCTECQPADEAISEKVPLLGQTAPASKSSWVQWLGWHTAPLVRAFAWFAHSFLDGCMLGTAPSLSVLLATTVPVAVCAVQDAASLVISSGASGYSHRMTIVNALVLAAGFPLGAVMAAASTEASAAESSVALAYLRASVGGIFLYMALFELAPPHLHGRWASSKLLLAFVVGLALAYASEMIEQAMLSHPELGTSPGAQGHATITAEGAARHDHSHIAKR